MNLEEDVGKTVKITKQCSSFFNANPLYILTCNAIISFKVSKETKLEMFVGENQCLQCLLTDINVTMFILQDF